MTGISIYDERIRHRPSKCRDTIPWCTKGYLVAEHLKEETLFSEYERIDTSQNLKKKSHYSYYTKGYVTHPLKVGSLFSVYERIPHSPSKVTILGIRKDT